MNRPFITILSIICITLISAQEKKSLNISKTNTPPKIDGILDDDVWQNTQEAATDFIQFRPEMGITETPETRTVVKVTYNDDAIYVGAYLYDDPSKIIRQFTSRDNFGQNDFFAFVLNPNNDGQNNTIFFVLSSGTQLDALESPGRGEDFSWNAVWDSAVKIVDDGWVVEIKIPYRTLRFSEDVETWGMQIHRHFRRDRSQYTWNPIDVTKGNAGIYNGELKGLKNLNPPTRLTFYPFVSGIYNSFDGESETEFNAGMDVKYGITENFTLDATLIPDFSQAGFDNVVLNLGPFEQTFSEQRQFFTEGVDLFTKGNLFFSRRVGNGPTGSVNINNNEELIEYPDIVKVLNAVKVSGRTKNGLGAGIFNSITEKTYASIENTETGERRKELVEPFSNYNILVVDQQFNQNSSVSIINTNVMREGSFRDANVTGLLADLTTKANTYNLEAEVKMSNVKEDGETQTGYSYAIEVGKVFGNWQYRIEHNYADDVYDINDLGLQFRNNFNNYSADISYRIFEPKGKFNNYRVNAWYNYRRLATPNTYTGSNFGAGFRGQLKSLDGFGGSFSFQPGKQYDYFEPRQEGSYFVFENRLNGNIWFSSNYNRKFALDVNFGGSTFFEEDRETSSVSIRFSPRVRFNDKLLIVYSLNFDTTYKNRGYANSIGNSVIFGQRDRRTIVNSLSGSYGFNPFHTLGLTFRNYWSAVDYEDNIYILQDDGSLAKQDASFEDVGLPDPNINFSTWNLDLSYSWQFAPGSFLTALYRNQLFSYDSESDVGYTESLNTLFKQPIQNTFSLRIQYFIDYNNIKKIFRKKTDA